MKKLILLILLLSQSVHAEILDSLYLKNCFIKPVDSAISQKACKDWANALLKEKNSFDINIISIKKSIELNFEDRLSRLGSERRQALNDFDTLNAKYEILVEKSNNTGIELNVLRSINDEESQEFSKNLEEKTIKYNRLRMKYDVLQSEKKTLFQHLRDVEIVALQNKIRILGESVDTEIHTPNEIQINEVIEKYFISTDSNPHTKYLHVYYPKVVSFFDEFELRAEIESKEVCDPPGDEAILCVPFPVRFLGNNNSFEPYISSLSQAEVEFDEKLKWKITSVGVNNPSKLTVGVLGAVNGSHNLTIHPVFSSSTISGFLIWMFKEFWSVLILFAAIVPVLEYGKIKNYLNKRRTRKI